MKMTIQEQIQATMALPTPTERLKAFVAIRATGERGVVALRARQKRVSERLAAVLRSKAERAHKRVKVVLPRYTAREEYQAQARAKRLDAGLRDGVEICASVRRTKAQGNEAALLAIAERYHRVMGPQHNSSRAQFHHGAAVAREEYLYAKSYRHPARWTDPGVHVDYTTRQIVLESYRGKITRLPLPPFELIAKIPANILIGQDLAAVPVSGRRCAGGDVWERWACDGSWGRTGLAVVWPDGRTEHGSGRAEILSKIKHKKETEAQRAAEAANADRIEKLTRRIALGCPGLLVSVGDARSAGNCRAGIEGFIRRAGIEGDKVPAGLLWRFVGTDFEGARIRNTIFAAARRVAVSRVCK
jgi:hypothetical protein